MKKFKLEEVFEIIVEAETAEEVAKSYHNNEYIIDSEDFKGIKITEYKDLQSRADRAISFCNDLIDNYDKNIDLTDCDICHIIEILKGRE